MKKIILIFLVALAFAGCKKEATEPEVCTCTFYIYAESVDLDGTTQASPVVMFKQ